MAVLTMVASNTVTSFEVGQRLFDITPVVEKMLFVALPLRSMAQATVSQQPSRVR